MGLGWQLGAPPPLVGLVGAGRGGGGRAKLKHRDVDARDHHRMEVARGSRQDQSPGLGAAPFPDPSTRGKGRRLPWQALGTWPATTERVAPRQNGPRRAVAERGPVSQHAKRSALNQIVSGGSQAWPSQVTAAKV